MLDARFSVVRARRRLTLRGISSMALHDRSSSVRVVPMETGARRIRQSGTQRRSSPAHTSDGPASSTA